MSNTDRRDVVVVEAHILTIRNSINRHCSILRVDPSTGDEGRNAGTRIGGAVNDPVAFIGAEIGCCEGFVVSLVSEQILEVGTGGGAG
jgi:hypothetical protein